MRVIVVGTGEVGQPLYDLLKSQRMRVDAYDLTDNVPKPAAKKYAVMHVCFPYTSVFDQEVVDYAHHFKPDLTIIESTVVPGTTRRIAAHVDGMVCHSPVLGRVADTFKWALKGYTKFIGPMDATAGSVAATHYTRLGITPHVCAKPEDTEWAKLLETSYWGLLLGWFQEIERISHQYDLDTKTIIRFFSNVQTGSQGRIPRPVLYVGNIGGHCVIPNARLLMQFYDSNFVAAVIRSQLTFEASMRHVYNQGEDAACVLCGTVYTRKVIRNMPLEPFFIIQCLTCREPMVVFRSHREPNAKHLQQAINVATHLYPHGVIDHVRGSIPAHPHFHVRLNP